MPSPGVPFPAISSWRGLPASPVPYTMVSVIPCGMSASEVRHADDVHLKRQSHRASLYNGGIAYPKGLAPITSRS